LLTKQICAKKKLIVAGRNVGRIGDKLAGAFAYMRSFSKLNDNDVRFGACIENRPERFNGNSSLPEYGLGAKNRLAECSTGRCC
jgi:hypothetical protein